MLQDPTKTGGVGKYELYQYVNNIRWQCDMMGLLTGSVCGTLHNPLHIQQGYTILLDLP
jgi:hypothetical protein